MCEARPEKTLRRPPEFRLIVTSAGLNETFTSASCVICNWLPYLSFIIASASHVRTFASQGLTPQFVISYPISSHLRHICASSYLRFLIQIFTPSLSSSGLHILRPHLVFTRSDLHRRVALSLSYHLQDFIMQLFSQLYNLIYLRLQNFISPLSGQPSSSCGWGHKKMDNIVSRPLSDTRVWMIFFFTAPLPAVPRSSLL